MLYAQLLSPTAKLDISSLLKPSSPSPPHASHPPLARSVSVPTSSSHVPIVSSPSTSTASHLSISTAPPNTFAPAPQPQQLQLPRLPGSNLSVPPLSSSSHSKRAPPTAAHPSATPAKKQNTKWAADEDQLITSLRGSGMKWDDISKRLPGRTSIACRLHYQNYLEKKQPWDEEKKDKLARLYDRIKPEIWAPLAKELNTPWRAVEAMHWALGEHEMARRAGSVPFNLAAAQSANPASVSSSSSASGFELSNSGYGLPEGYSIGEVGRESEDREPGLIRRQRRPPGTQPMMYGEQLAPVGQGASAGQGGQGVILPSLAELTGAIPAPAGFVRERVYPESSQQGRTLPGREPPSQPRVKIEKPDSGDDKETKDEEVDETQRQQQ